MHIPDRAQHPSLFCWLMETRPQVTKNTQTCAHICLQSIISSQQSITYPASCFTVISTKYNRGMLCLCRGEKFRSNTIKCEKGNSGQISSLLSWFWLWRKFRVSWEDVTTEQWCGTTHLWRLRCWFTTAGIVKHFCTPLTVEKLTGQIDLLYFRESIP